MTSLHVASIYLAHGDRETAESLTRPLLPWAHRSVLPEPDPKKAEATRA